MAGGGGGNSLFSKTVQTASEAHPAVSGHQGISFGVKELGLEVNRSLPSSAEVKNWWSYISTHSMNLLVLTGTTSHFTLPRDAIEKLQAGNPYSFMTLRV